MSNSKKKQNISDFSITFEEMVSGLLKVKSDKKQKNRKSKARKIKIVKNQ